MAHALSLSLSLSVSGDVSILMQLIDLAAYTISAQGVDPVSPLKRVISVLLTLIKPTDNLREELNSQKS